MLNDLESTIHQVIVSAAATMAQEISRAVRAALAAEIVGSTPAKPTPRRARRRAAAVTTRPARVKRGRTAARSSGGKAHPRRSYTDRDVAAVLELIRARPGLRSEQYASESKLAHGPFKKVLAKLREEGRVKTEGEKRATTYKAA